MSDPIRVIQWATGSVGRHAIPAIHEDPALELVGAWVHSEAKAGRDVGELAGSDPVGVLASRDVDALLALDADCVLYAPLLADLDEMCRILAAGKSIVTPTGWVYLKDREIADRIEAACAEGNASFHGTGIHPGFGGDRLPLLMTGLSRRIDAIRVHEICDLSNMSESPEMVFDQLGFGASREEAATAPPLLGIMSTIFFESMDLIAAGLGFELDEHVSRFEPAFAKRDLEVAAGRIKEGHVAGQHYEYLGRVDGRTVIEFQTYWKMSHEIDPVWPHMEATLEYLVEIEGDPPLRCRFGPIIDDDSAEFGLVATAMNCVNAIRPVCEADPGIRTTLDLPLIVGRGRVSL